MYIVEKDELTRSHAALAADVVTETSSIATATFAVRATLLETLAIAGQLRLAWTRRVVNTGLRGHVGWSTYGRLPPPFPVDCVVHSPSTSSSDATPTCCHKTSSVTLAYCKYRKDTREIFAYG